MLARYAREERELTEAASVPLQPVELYIPSGELWGEGGVMKKIIIIVKLGLQAPESFNLVAGRALD